MIELAPVWHAAAACWGLDSSIFFVNTGESARPARDVCDRCSVRAECLNWAIRLNIHYGIWGGMTGRERNRVAKRLVAAGVPT